MTDCTHSFCSDVPPVIRCRKCGEKADCESRKYGRKTHRFVNRRCIKCGLSQMKIADYLEVLVI